MKSLLALSLFFAGCFGLSAQGATFTSVNPATDVLTITNTGSSMVNLDNYWLCLGPGTYVRVGTVTPINGDFMLMENESVTLSYNVSESEDGLSLFSTNSFSSSDPNVLASYVQWGAANQPRVGQAVTAGRWDNANSFISGNGPYTTATGGSAAAWTVCDAQGGAIQIAGTTDTTAEICVGEGTDDLIEVEFVDMSVLSGDNSTWVITDQATGNILGTPATVPPGGFSLEGAPAGICDIWYLRYTGDIGLGTATNVADLSGCFDLSNPISITRLTGTDCDALSIDEIDLSFDVNIHPNPSRGIVNISYSGTRTLDVEIQVIDILGKQVYELSTVINNEATIDMSNMENGTYFINITEAETGSRIVKRVIKN